MTSEEDLSEDEEECSSDYSSDDSFDESKVGIALELPKRENRGKKYSQLVGDELEKDQQFWAHETWEEDAVDDDYNCSEGEEQYVYSTDSDFDDPEEEEDQEVDENRFKERKKKRHGVYVDPVLLRNKRTLQAISKRRASTSEHTPKKKPAPKSVVIEEGVTRERRETTKKKTEAIRELEERRKIRKTEQVFVERKSKKAKTRQKVWTHEELMEQARKTEEANTKSLEHLQAWEDDKKRYTEQKKYNYKGHYDIWISWNSLLSVVNANDQEVAPPPSIEEKPLELYMFTTGQLPEFYTKLKRDKEELEQWKPPKSYRTGEVAKYFDPLSGEYYNTIDEFRLLRIAHHDEKYNLWSTKLDIVERCLLDNLGIHRNNTDPSSSRHL